ncbi:hypothetical protein AVEN_38522-1 [Araneus ventricosus]|uniref:Transposase Tc1-like domain-containing protein n=1 Tax=Araneus ventricosus TaxID=182803 RepID=A0A4Y2MKR1_ARAVE|nr:hypothetical protein AVEN_38522-1 [Araneus ventricosus]
MIFYDIFGRQSFPGKYFIFSRQIVPVNRAGLSNGQSMQLSRLPRHVSSRPRVTKPAEDSFLVLSARRRRSTTVPQLVADHYVASGRRISATTVRRRLQNSGLYARRPVVCVPLNGRQRRARLCWVRKHVSWIKQQWASVLFTDESRFTLESDSGRLLIWREQRTRYNQSNTLERHSYRGGGIMVRAGISHDGEKIAKNSKRCIPMTLFHNTSTEFEDVNKTFKEPEFKEDANFNNVCNVLTPRRPLKEAYGLSIPPPPVPDRYATVYEKVNISPIPVTQGGSGQLDLLSLFHPDVDVRRISVEVLVELGRLPDQVGQADEEDDALEAFPDDVAPGRVFLFGGIVERDFYRRQDLPGKAAAFFTSCRVVMRMLENRERKAMKDN